MKEKQGQPVLIKEKLYEVTQPFIHSFHLAFSYEGELHEFPINLIKAFSMSVNHHTLFLLNH